mmetsp:Transcript_19530/g.35415  ORF Transcript_19530/g.35415 Transcript_19530/m.35415 type:complete len:322 (+) Transcript_19530:174-1139(+)
MLTVESTLPRHILVNSVLSYLDLSTLIKFSCCSPQCQTIVFQEMPKTSWNEITLSGNLTITDDQLCVFLRNIRAKENTRILSLVGCVNIKGPGLEPLYGSDVLENIDLRILGSLPLTGELGTMCGPSGLMDDCVARILFSMLPLSQREWEEPGIWYAKATKRPKISLRRVAIRPLKPTVGMSIHYSPILRNFFTCHGFLIGRSATPIAPLTCPPNACSLCFIEIDYQQEGIFCPTCNKNYCKSCAMSPKCAECSKRKCQWCSNVVQCAGGRCGKRSCASHGYECCGGCDNVFCLDCQDYELEFCVVCNEFYCSEECHRGAH